MEQASGDYVGLADNMVKSLRTPLYSVVVDEPSTVLEAADTAWKPSGVMLTAPACTSFGVC